MKKCTPCDTYIRTLLLLYEKVITFNQKLYTNNAFGCRVELCIVQEGFWQTLGGLLVWGQILKGLMVP